MTNFLHELFVRFGVPNTIVSDNGMQFVSFEFKKFCKMFAVEHLTIAPYHPRSNGQVELFVDTFKRALRKSNKEIIAEVALQQFLRVYQLTPNPNTPADMSPAELMFARKIKSVFNKLLPGKKRKIAMDKKIVKMYLLGHIKTEKVWKTA
ncbi:uncharacterized protein K02A2.6-like [Octopus bimaculoides]|uniref:uncharacterized protein K02A2.6-like n=1 Tax=Octopus bimaculoides TaxID=37653 RepID=UPI00071CE6B8|nr:uncharacterized protein K02A2.6-like [Octopus bimaculoides]|eukprot:XP_014777996.1 PREDICTED: uncharacterized protein K02A2.6-like [Octopus bimaculoides]